jgi:transcriptional regulator with XRE-family HTH domain
MIKKHQYNQLFSQVGNRIKEVRLRRGLSQAKVAKAAKLTLKSYQRIENSPQNVTLETLASIANALDLAIHDLIPKTKRAKPVKPLGGFETAREAVEFAVQVLRSYQSVDED